MKRSAAIGRLDAAIPPALTDAHARFIEAVAGATGGEFLVATYLLELAIRLVEDAAALVTETPEEYRASVQGCLAKLVSSVSLHAPRS